MTRFSRSAYIWIAVLIISTSIPVTSGHAQIDTLDDQWRWVRFTTESGLPTNDVKVVTQTPNGTIWAGTFYGLAWFDGFRWNRLGSESGVPEGRLLNMRAFSQDSLLVITDSRLYMGGKEGFEQIPVIVNGSEQNVYAAAEFENGKILILANNLLNLYQNGTISEYSPFPGVSADQIPISSLYTTRSGPWISNLTGLYQWIADKWVLRLGDVPTGYVEFHSPHQNVRGPTFIHCAHPPSLAGSWILDDDNPPLKLSYDEEWGAITGNDVGPLGDVLTVYNIAGAKALFDGDWIDVQLGRVNTNSVNNIKYDSRGNLWISTTEGLYLHRRQADLWKRIRFPIGDDRNSINAILKSTDGTIWLGTNRGVVRYSTDGSTEYTEKIDNTTLGVVTGLVEDTEGNIWVDSGVNYGGVFRWDGDRWEHFGPDDGLTAAKIHKIDIDRHGRLWFLGLGEEYPGPGAEDAPQPGVFVFSNGQFENWNTEDGLLHGRVYSFAENDEGSLWFGTFGGLSRWDGEEWTHWTADDNLLMQAVSAICIDKNDRVWFAHQGTGLGYLEYEQLHYMKMSEGLISLNIRDLKIDDRNRLWISTWSGIAFYDDESWISFSTLSGLSSSRVWPILPVDNQVYIGTLGTGLDILDLSVETAENPIVDLADAAFDGRDTILQWRAFSYLGALEPLQIDTRYKLNEELWSEWSRLREIRFEDLAPGNYTFTVQARGMLGSFDATGFTSAFTVAIPFYFSLPFVLPIGFLLFISIYLWIDKRKRREEYIAELYESEERYRTLFDSSPFGIAIHDEDTLLFTNTAGAALLGFSDPEEVSGMPLADHMSIKDWDMVQNYLSQGAGENARNPLREISLFRIDRSEINTEWEVIPYVYMGLPAFLSVFIDVTDRKHLEAQLLQSQKMQAVGVLAGGIAHDFNNLLTAISGYSEVMLENMKKKDKNRLLIEEIQMASDRATTLTNQLLVFSRQEVIESRTLDLTSIIGDMAEMLKRLIGENVNLAIDFDPVLDSINADQGQIEQLIMNLILNSRDAMPGGGNITIKARNIVFEEKDDRKDYELGPGQYVMVSVSDTGTGIHEDIRDRIFEPFFTTKEPGRGTGLGLATVHGIVQRFGGDIQVEDVADGGTCFEVLFPVSDGDITPSTMEDFEEDIDEGSGNILLVEDENVVRNYVERVLTDGGYRVMSAADGAEALRISSEFPEDIRILVTDVMMPGMDGKELAGNLLKSRPDLKVLFLSGYADDVIGRTDKLKSGQGFLKKPVKPKQLLLRIQELLTDG